MGTGTSSTRRPNKRRRETAIRVLMQSKIVRNWVENEAAAFGVDLNTPAGREFYERESRREAERLIK